MQIVQGVYENGKITLYRDVNIKNVRITVIFSEEGNNTTRKTLKSKGVFNHCVDISKIAGEKDIRENIAVEYTKTEEPRKLKAYGILNELLDITNVEGEKGAWERAVVEKYAKNSGA